MLYQLTKFNSTPTRGYNIKEEYVQTGLAVTPSEMLQMAQSGVPISSQMADNLFYDGDTSMAVELDPLDQRGLDIVDVWNMQHDARKKIRKVMDSEISTSK